jgi:bifunctional non-homologous end joining protein LigD
MARIVSHLRFVEPQLLTPTDQPPQGSNWIHEVKHDGYRTLLRIERGNVCALHAEWLRLE